MALLQLVLRQAVQIDGRHDHARLHEPALPNEKPPHPANARAFAPVTEQSPKRQFPLILRVDGAVASRFEGPVVVQPERGALSISDDHV